MNVYEKLAKRFENRIQKIEDTFDLIDSDSILLGYIKVFDEEYTYLLKYTQTLLKKYSAEALNSYKECQFIIVLALVQVAIRERIDENDYNGFWEKLKKIIGIYDDEIINKCKGVLKRFFIFNGYYFQKTENMNEYVKTIYSHSIVPNTYAKRIFDFLYNAYVKDLEEEYDELFIDEYLSDLFEFFETNDTAFYDSDSIQDSKIRQQYLLPKQFRIACLQSKSILKEFIKKQFFNIDRACFKNELPDNTGMFSKSFIEWWSSIENQEMSIYQKEHNFSGKRNRKFEKRFTCAYFELVGDDLYINLPQQRLKSSHAENDITIHFYNGNKPIHIFNKALRVFGHIRFRTEEERIKLSSFYTQLRYEIRSGDKIVFNSEERLYRDCIFFNSYCVEFDSRKLTAENIDLLALIDSEIIADCYYEKSFKENYTIYHLLLGENDSFIINDRFYSANSKNVQDGMLYKNKVNTAAIIYCGKKYDVYSSLPSFGIRTEKGVDSSKYVVSVNNMMMRLADFKNAKSTLIEDGTGLEYISCILDEKEIEYNEFYSFIVRKSGDTRLKIKEDFIVVPNFKCSFENELYYRQKSIDITGLNGNGLVLENEHFPTKVQVTAEEAVSFSAFINQKPCEVQINLPILTWEIGSITSYDNNCGAIWHDELDTKAEFIVHYNLPVQIDLIINRDSRVKGVRKSGGYSFTIRNELNLFQDTEIGVEIAKKYLKLTEIAFYPRVVNVNCKYYKQTNILICSWRFLGEGQLNIQIIDTIGTLMLNKDVDVAYLEEKILLNDGFYKVIIRQKEEDEFGLSDTDKINVLHISELIVGDVFYLNLKDRNVQVTNCYYYDTRYEIDNFYFDCLKIEQENVLYTANAFFYKRNRSTGELFKWYLKESNPVNIEVWNKQGGNYVVEIRETSEDGFIYDTETKHIISGDGIKGNKRYKTADYYIIEMESSR